MNIKKERSIHKSRLCHYYIFGIKNYIFYVPLAYILHLLESCRFSKRICFPRAILNSAGQYVINSLLCELNTYCTASSEVPGFFSFWPGRFRNLIPRTFILSLSFLSLIHYGSRVFVVRDTKKKPNVRNIKNISCS